MVSQMDLYKMNAVNSVKREHMVLFEFFCKLLYNKVQMGYIQNIGTRLHEQLILKRDNAIWRILNREHKNCEEIYYFFNQMYRIYILYSSKPLRYLGKLITIFY